MTRREEIDLYISELRHTVTVAAINYDIWRVYKDTRPKYVASMRHYNQFFSASIHAHFVALVIALYRLYEDKPDTFNIPKLLARLKEGGDLPGPVTARLCEIKKEAEPVWKKIKILRNRVFGHRSKRLTRNDLPTIGRVISMR